MTLVTFKHCALFIKCITKIDGTGIYDTENLDLVILIYNLLQYSSERGDNIMNHMNKTLISAPSFKKYWDY